MAFATAATSTFNGHFLAAWCRFPAVAVVVMDAVVRRRQGYHMIPPRSHENDQLVAIIPRFSGSRLKK